MLAYKGFHHDLTCTKGNGRYQYVRGVVLTEDKSKCAGTGFHCTENPLECLDWYPLGEGNRYFLVEAGGSLDEDGKDAKIACTQIKLVEELDVRALVFHAIVYMVKHPLRRWEKTGHMLDVKRDAAEAREAGAIAIARGQAPKVRGKAGSVLGLVVENEKGDEILRTKFFVAAGQAKPDTWYTLDGQRQLKEVG